MLLISSIELSRTLQDDFSKGGDNGCPSLVPGLGSLQDFTSEGLLPILGFRGVFLAGWNFVK